MSVLLKIRKIVVLSKGLNNLLTGIKKKEVHSGFFLGDIFEIEEKNVEDFFAKLENILTKIDSVSVGNKEIKEKTVESIISALEERQQDEETYIWLEKSPPKGKMNKYIRLTIYYRDYLF